MVVTGELPSGSLDRVPISGAGLDVFEHEPDVHQRPLEAPDVILRPHIGRATVATRAAMARAAAADAVLAVLDCRRPDSLVTAHWSPTP